MAEDDPIPAKRLFVPDDLAPGADIEPDEGQAHYLMTVLRLGQDDEVALFNGRDGEWRARVRAVSRKKCRLAVVDRLRPQVAEPDLWLCFAPIKRARIDFVAEKATELGVAVIQPVITRRTIVARVNGERLAANAREAAEQCDRLAVPEVRDAVPLDRLLDRWPAGRRLMFCDESRNAPPAAAALAATGAAGQPWAVLIGPEGGFAPEEMARLRAHPGVLAVGLGPRLLRADTAAVAALSLFQGILGDWRSY